MRMFFSSVFVLLILVLFSGCATTTEVKKIIELSNAEIIQNMDRLEAASRSMSDIAMLSLAPDGSLPADPARSLSGWQAQVQRIEQFIAEHPELNSSNNALRIREAVVLLSAGQIALAEAVFGEINQARLKNQRDQALYAAHEPLLWWYGLGRIFSQSGEGCSLVINRNGRSDCARALKSLKVLAEVIDDPGIALNPSTAIARFLEQVRVRIALRLANALDSEEDVHRLLSEALQRYEKQFSKTDRASIQAWHLGQKLNREQQAGLLMSLRWYDYVPRAYRLAEKIRREVCSEDCPGLTPEWVQCIEDGTCDSTD